MKKIVNVVAAIIKRNDTFLIARRGYGEFKGLYEFPGGKVELHESKEEALIRELKEEMDANIEIDYFFYHDHYEYSSFILEMDCYVCHLVDDNITLLEHLDYQWITKDSNNVNWVPGDIPVINEIKKRGI